MLADLHLCLLGFMLYNRDSESLSVEAYRSHHVFNVNASQAAYDLSPGYAGQVHRERRDSLFQVSWARFWVSMIAEPIGTPRPTTKVATMNAGEGGLSVVYTENNTMFATTYAA